MSTITPREKEVLAQAAAAVEQKQAGKAVELLRQLIKEVPDSLGAHTQLGALLSRAGHSKAAESHLQTVVKLSPKNPQSWRNLVTYYISRKQYRRANETLVKLLALNPDDEVALQQQLLVQRETRSYAEALATADKIIASGKADANLQLRKAELLTLLKREAEAMTLYDALQDRDEAPMERFEPWVRLASRFERNAQVIQWCRRRLDKKPELAGYLMLCAALIPESRYLEAYEVLQAALKLEPNDMRVHHDLGVVLRYLGRIEESHQHLERALEQDPRHVSALRVYGSEHKYQYGDAAFGRLQRAAAHLAEYSPLARVQLHYALGKAFDDLDDPATAFEHYIQAGKVHLRETPVDDTDKHFFVARKRYTPQVLREPAEPGSDSEVPVFVLGMPRSGTSLVEQVLASHPQVYGAGELKLMSRVIDGIVAAGFKLELGSKAPLFPNGMRASWKQRGDAYVEQLKAMAPAGSEYARIVDKMPTNYMWVGMIHLMMPKAKIIHSRRHPMETCLSAFRIYFPDGQYWSYDLRRMGKTYRRYLDYMQQWRETLPEGRMLEVRYEDMVGNLEQQARSLIDYCNLPWDPACLNFHETERAVRTASTSQVRKPVYQTSMNRWRKYEPYLKPLLEELGPVVKEYEDELLGGS